jgi:hypothetical protein
MHHSASRTDTPTPTPTPTPHPPPPHPKQAAAQHPYVVKPSAGQVGSWLACGCLMAVLGFCCVNPDGGDYNVWLPQVRICRQRYQAVSH